MQNPCSARRGQRVPSRPYGRSSDARCQDHARFAALEFRDLRRREREAQPMHRRGLAVRRGAVFIFGGRGLDAVACRCPGRRFPRCRPASAASGRGGPHPRSPASAWRSARALRDQRIIGFQLAGHLLGAAFFDAQHLHAPAATSCRNSRNRRWRRGRLPRGGSSCRR